eukprot:gene42480-56457_t
MAFTSFRMRILIFAAYLLAAVLPVLALGEGRGQSQVDHAQTMAMAGHLMPMQTTDGPDSDAQQVLCQQHCLFATAALPEPNGGTEVVVRAADVELRFDFDLTLRFRPEPETARPNHLAIQENSHAIPFSSRLFGRLCCYGRIFGPARSGA